MIIFNKLLVVIVAFLIGVSTTMAVGGNSPEIDPTEYFETEANLRMDIQENFLRFYKEEYCKNLSIRTVIVHSFGIQINGIHCNNGIVLVLDENNLPTTFISDGIRHDVE